MDKEYKGTHGQEHQAILKQIGLNILYYRKEKDYTQQQLAELVSYSKNHIQQVETAQTAPSLLLLLDIAKVLEIPVEKLFEKR